MRFTITGADRQTGKDAQITLAAESIEEAERLATKQGMLVASIRPAGGAMATDVGTSPLPIWDEDPSLPEAPAASRRGGPSAAPTANPTPAAPAAPPAAGEEQRSIAAPTHTTPQYHVVQNPSLSLLEAAVNKQIKEGWEPLGGVQASNWNNQMQFYQTMVRRPV